MTVIVRGSNNSGTSKNRGRSIKMTINDPYVKFNKSIPLSDSIKKMVLVIILD